MKPWFNCHCHTDYSNALLGFPDVLSRVEPLIEYAYECGLGGLAITEHEGISSHIQALNAYGRLKKAHPDCQMKLALGNEIYLLKDHEYESNRDKDGVHYPYYHAILIALDTEGHKQLRQISTKAWLRAFTHYIMRRPTLYSDLEEIVKPNQGHLVYSTACMGSRIDKILMGEIPEAKPKTHDQRLQMAKQELEALTAIFGKGNVYLEVQPPSSRDSPQAIVNQSLLELSALTNVPLVPSTDVHYLRKKDRQSHEIFLRSKEGEREIDGFYATTYMMGSEELTDYFVEGGFEPDTVAAIIQNSNDLLERVGEYNIKHLPIIPEIPPEHIPPFHTKHTFAQWYDKYPAFKYYATEVESTHERYFFFQIEEGLTKYIVNNPAKADQIESYIARLNEEWTELKIISETLETKMVCYYSTMSKIIDLIWGVGSLAGPARGSAAGFLTCYLLEVTQIDPVPLGDYFPSWRHLESC